MLSRVTLNSRRFDIKSINQSIQQCGPGRDRVCVLPSKKSGYLIVGSGVIQEFNSGPPENIIEKIVVDQPEQICFEVIAKIPSCGFNNFAKGVAAAIVSLAIPS